MTHGKPHLIKLLTFHCARMSHCSFTVSKPHVRLHFWQTLRGRSDCSASWHYLYDTDLFLVFISLYITEILKRRVFLITSDIIREISAFVFMNPISWNSLFNNQGDPSHILWPSLLISQIKSNHMANEGSKERQRTLVLRAENKWPELEVLSVLSPGSELLCLSKSRFNLQGNLNSH